MNQLKKLDRVLSRIEVFFLSLSVLALIGASLLVLFAVPARNYPAFAVPDNVLFVQSLLLTSIALGLGRATGLGEHIAVDLLYNRFSERLKWATRVVALCAGLIFFVPLAWWYSSLALEFFESGRTQYGSLRLPKWPPYLVISFGFWLVSLRLTLQLLNGASETEKNMDDDPSASEH